MWPREGSMASLGLWVWDFLGFPVWFLGCAAAEVRDAGSVLGRARGCPFAWSSWLEFCACFGVQVLALLRREKRGGKKP